MLAQGLVLSKLSFCICYWGGTQECNKKDIQIKMIEAARIILGADRLIELNALYSEINDDSVNTFEI